MNCSQIELIIFDWDETLVNPVGLYKEYVKLRTEDIARALNMSEEKASKKIRKLRELGATTETIYDLAGVSNGELYGKWVWYKRMCGVSPSNFMQRDQSLVDLLNSLQQKKILITGEPFEQLYKMFNAAGLPKETFDKIIAWNWGDEPPKNPTTYKRILESQLDNTKPEKVVVVGNDIAVDLKVPKELGMRTILVGNDIFNTGSLNQYVDLQIENIKNLPKALYQII